VRRKGAFLFSSTITGVIEEILPLFSVFQTRKGSGSRFDFDLLWRAPRGRGRGASEAKVRPVRVRPTLSKAQRLPTAAADRPTILVGEKEEKVDGESRLQYEQ